ncbi:uncharacterized protein LOC111691269 [Anoplophora glabripennis]|uniref:uncharacterized protein LOC111691269 n=1 Tax=Anoplophora glabripennis TaxID=217634 RepID=UPI000873785B|nr:uncharacterized protein LOC111691269 [Anoplophora glabripennis]
MQPENIKEIFCRLCGNIISETHCEVIGEVLREVLEFVLPNVNLEERDKHVICKTCSVKLSAAFNFKMRCKDTEDIISSFVNSSKASVVDLKMVYLKGKGNIQLADVSENHKICRLCIQLLTDGFVSLNEVDVDIIDEFIPHLNLAVSNDPVICGPCFDSLHTHRCFLKNCLDAQEKYKSVDRQSHIISEEIAIKLEGAGQDVQEIHESICEQSYIKSEEIAIKLEDGQDTREKYKWVEPQSCIKSEDIEIKVEDEEGFDNGKTVQKMFIFRIGRRII